MAFDSQRTVLSFAGGTEQADLDRGIEGWPLFQLPNQRTALRELCV